MPLILAVFSGFALWLMGEFLAFSLVARAIGLEAALAATLLTSLLGAFILRRLGSAARRELLELVQRGSGSFFLAPERLRAGFLTSIGAFLLLLPGFLSDGIGLLLLVRAMRTRARSGAHFGPTGDEVIELSPQDWRRLDETNRG